MKVELSIKDDKELRNLIKDMIRGQVVSVVRQEIEGIVINEISRKLEVSLPKMIEKGLKADVSKRNLDKDVKSAIKKIVTEKVEREVFNKAFEMRNAYDKSIEVIVKKHMAGISLKVA